MNDEIAVECRGFKICRRQVKKILTTLRECAPWEFPAGWLSVAFVDDETTCRLHEQYLGDPSKTDVITFPGDKPFAAPIRHHPAKKSATVVAEESHHQPDHHNGGGDHDDAFAGEIVVCVNQAIRAAATIGNQPADEILLYLVHGWLHLAGLDDTDDDSRALMRKAESEALAILRDKGVAPITRISFPANF
ncbi:MAG: rRNA maturation RNase YbeY [Opitutae bacterium]|nr:rRNA maturation RNase YbeY [Opitutae bacterium]